MKCAEFHELAASYALDALSEEERLACARHLAEEGPHESCEVLLARYELAVAAYSELAEARPPVSELWPPIEQRTVGKSADVRPIGAAAKRTGPPRREVAAWAVAAAASFALVFSYRMQASEDAARSRSFEVLAKTQRELGARADQTSRALVECTRDLSALEARDAIAPIALSLLEDPATVVRPMDAASARPLRATALYNPKQRRAVMLSSKLAAIEGKDYELWVIAAGEAPKPAGFVRFSASGVAVGEFDAALLRGAAPAALAVSLEPLGGRPTPTEVVLLAKLKT